MNGEKKKNQTVRFSLADNNIQKAIRSLRQDGIKHHRGTSEIIEFNG
jgi:hypothetical protein